MSHPEFFEDDFFFIKRIGISIILVCRKKGARSRMDNITSFFSIFTTTVSSPMYLLTNLEIDLVGMAWQMFFAYTKGWDIEQVFRYGKSELAMESPDCGLLKIASEC